MRENRRIRRKRKRAIRWTLFTLAIIVPAIVIGGLYGVSYLAGPPPLKNEPHTVYYSKDDQILGEEGGTNSKKYVPLSDISQNLINATIAIEDQNFYHHHGFDIKRIGGAILSDIRNMSLKEGASTLTQQYARNLYLSHEKTWTRKAKEAFYTIRLEMFYPKDKILEGYLNMIYYGHGAYGIEAASQYYFGKHASDLSLAQAAMLAGIPKGPTYYSPFNDRERAESRQKRILSVMKEEKMITESEYLQASNETLVYNTRSEQKEDVTGPYFQDMVQTEGAKLLNMDVESFRSGGYKVYTTVDKKMQQALEEEVKEQIRPDSDMEAGAMAMDPQSGEIRAVIGGRDYEKSAYNRAVSSIRMPGSTFKPFLYYAALENGYTPSTPLMSKPTTFELDNGQVYEPSNFNDYYGNKPITLAQALALSDNIYAVKTNIFLKPETLVKTARSFGITSKLEPVPSLALGTSAVSVKEMVAGYGMIANGGKTLKPHTIRKITDTSGDVLYERRDQPGKQVLDRQKAYVLTHMMTGVFDRKLDGYMSVTGATIADQLTREYAGKSGSTNSDSWMIGFSPDLVAGVWTGYDDNKDITETEEMGYAKNIWAGFMEKAHQKIKERPFLVPAGLVPVDIDPETGQRATPYCENKRTMYFEKDTVPQEHCTFHMHGEIPEEWLNREDVYPDKDRAAREEANRKKRKELFDKWKQFLE